MLKVGFSAARCTVSAHWTSEGSVFAGTISSTCHAVETAFELESDDDPARIAALIRNAEGGCYAKAALEQPVPVTGKVLVNGEPFDYEQFPRKVERRR